MGQNYIVTANAVSAPDIGLREAPSIDGKMVRRLQPEDVVVITDGPINADYRTWWKVKIGDVEGWIQGNKYWFDAVK